MQVESKNTLLFRDSQSGDERSLNCLVLDNMGLVKSAVRRFMGRGTDYDDLVQIGSIGLIKAAKAYKPELGFEFSTYAFSMIVGELRRYFRDNGLIKVSRDAKKQCARLLKEKELYFSEHGKEPTLTYLAEKCDINIEDAFYYMGALSPVESLNSPLYDEKISVEENRVDCIESFIEKYALKQTLSVLTKEEQLIIHLRYVLSLTQSETAARLGTNQVKVSRTEKKILEKLKRLLAV